jgi:hypothetical protein
VSAQCTVSSKRALAILSRYSAYFSFKTKNCRLMRLPCYLSVRPFWRLTDWHETWCDHYAIGHNANAVPFHALQTITRTWRLYELLELEVGCLSSASGKPTAWEKNCRSWKARKLYGRITPRQRLPLMRTSELYCSTIVRAWLNHRLWMRKCILRMLSGTYCF